jgi:hypothetical protein
MPSRPSAAPTRAGGVPVAPNPFTYATRSDKRLLEPLSTPQNDVELGVRPDERALLSVHVPETRVLRPENVDELARDKAQWFFKPCHGFASHGILTAAQVGRRRLGVSRRVRSSIRPGIPKSRQRRFRGARRLAAEIHQSVAARMVTASLIVSER